MVLARRPDPSASTRVWVFRSSDGLSWRRDSEPLAWGVSSLGLSVRADGEALLTLLQHVREPTWWERWRMPQVVYGLVSRDGHRWQGTHWVVHDPGALGIIDPQWLGDELWYFAPEGKSGDPAERAGDHRIRSWPPGRNRIKARGLADPSPVLLGDELFVFVTRRSGGGAGEVVEYAGDPLAPVHTFPGVSVPYATVVGEQLWLIAQRDVGGHRRPVRAISADGQTWSAWQPLGDITGLRSCTSPVVGYIGGEWLMLCVEEARP